MPLVIPPFTQFQGTLFPLRGLWNAKPAEGDRFVGAEVDWGSYPSGQGVQFQLSGNSPVALSQIVALTVDNSRCGSDVQFVFADSGFLLVVPARCQGVYPVFTNGLMFYVVALNAASNDITCLNVHNSMPPPIPVQLSGLQSVAGAAAILLANGTTPIIGASASGTLRGGTVSVDATSAAAGQSANLTLQDGRPSTIWFFQVSELATSTLIIPLPTLSVRFFNGVNLVISSSTITSGAVAVNLYYTSP